MGDAFDDVSDELRARNASPFDPSEIARRIIAMTRLGEKRVAVMAAVVGVVPDI
jgi:hypothetical protein